MPKIKNMGAGTSRFKEGIIVSGSAHQPNGSDSNYSLVNSGSLYCEGDLVIHGKESGSDEIYLRFREADSDRSIIGINSSNNLLLQNQFTNKHIVFKVNDQGATKEGLRIDGAVPEVVVNEGSDSLVDFRVESNNNTHMLFVDGSTDRVGVGTNSPTSPLHVQGNLSDYVVVIDNDENSSGHVLKLNTDGNGSGTRILEMEDGDGDIVFRARADGRFGFGPDGVSSMGAGTFVVGIDNSSHTSDIAISQRLQHLGDSNTYLDFPANDTLNLVAGGNSFLKYDGNILLNNANANVDTKIMADDGNVIFHADAGTNRVGIGTTSPTETLDVSGIAKATSLRTGLIEYTDGDDAITIDDGGYLKFHAGVKYARSVLISNGTSPAASDPNPDGGWIKFATFQSPGTSNLDTAASSFLVTICGMESSANRRIDGIFLVHARFTVNTNGNADSSSNYYESEGTRISCEPLNADFMAPSGANDFDPQTDLLMIATNTSSTPTVDLYIRSRAKSKHCFVTHLGGTGQNNTFDTDPGWTLNTGEAWSATEPAAPGGSVKITGTYVSKIFSNLTVNDVVKVGGTLDAKAITVNVRDVNSTSDIQATDYVLRCIQNQAITLTLPSKSTSAGRVLVFKDLFGNANTNNITIDGDGSDTIDGSATYVINHNKESVTLTCDGINGWMITSRFRP